MNRLLKNLSRFFRFQESLEPEAFYAYLNRLPEDISVAWRRDGGFIIGKIKDGEVTYMTQGKSDQEFIEMVNDAVYTYHGVPIAYREIISKVRAYNPPVSDIALLGDKKVSHSQIELRKEKQLVAS